MKRKLVYSVTALAAAGIMAFGVFGLAACGEKKHTHVDADKDGVCDDCGQSLVEPLTDKPLNTTTVIADWTGEEEYDEMYPSDGWSNMDSFNTEWDTERVSYEDGYAKMTLAPNPDGTEAECNEFFGGELRTRGYYGYGDYEVSMKPAKILGTASSFFVCTGNYDYQPDATEPNPWDEIDIEFLGKDTTMVQFNYFVNGVGHHEYKYKLGFDASEEFHTYGFRWAEDYITWFVDGKPVYRVDKSEENPMPATEGRILMNYWCGTPKSDNWMGDYVHTDSENGTEYQWVKTSAARAYDESEAGPAKELPDVEGVEFTDVDMSAVSAASTESKYVITEAENGFNVAYTELTGAFQNVAFGGMEAAAQTNNLFKAQITNNGSEAVNVRVDIMSSTNVNENHKVTNKLAMQDGVAVETNLEWGGSLFVIQPETTSEIVIEYNNSYPYSNIQFMLDSHLQDSPAVHSGDVTVSGFAFGANEKVSTEITPPEGGDTPVTGDLPDTEGVEFSAVSVADITVGGNTEIYTVEKVEDKLNITYGEFQSNYQNVSLSMNGQQENNLFKAKITNNGENPVNVRVDVMASFQYAANTAACNLIASQDGVKVNTDTTWGGSFFTVGASQTIEIIIEYNNAYQQSSVQFMLDSSSSGTAVAGGNVTISEIAFGKNANASTEVIMPPATEDPETPSGETAKLTFGSTADFTVTPNGTASESFTVTYTDLPGAAYDKNIISTDAAALAVGNDTFTITITNKGDAAVKVRVDILGTNAVETQEGITTTACNLSHTPSGDVNDWGYTDTTYGGTSIVVDAGATVTLTITYDGEGAWGAVTGILMFFDTARGDSNTYSGNLTIGNFGFSNSAEAAE